MKRKNLDAFSLYIEEVNSKPRLTAEEELSLAREAPSDPSAREKLIEANLGLPIYIVTKQFGFTGSSALDLIQEGNLGLMNATDTFDPDKGVRFSTFAAHWVRWAVASALETQGRAIVLPAQTAKDVAKANRLTEEFERDNGREPTAEEMAELLNIPIEKYHLIEQARALRNIASTDLPVDDAGEMTVGDLISDAPSDMVEAAAFSLLKDIVVASMETYLSETEIIAACMRFGLYDGRRHTHVEMADAIGLSKERIRQMEAGILRKMRGTGKKGRNEPCLAEP